MTSNLLELFRSAPPVPATASPSIALLHEATRLRAWGRIFPSLLVTADTLTRLAPLVAKMERTLDELCAEAEEEDRLSRQGGNVVPIRGNFW